MFLGGWGGGGVWSLFLVVLVHSMCFLDDLGPVQGGKDVERVGSGVGTGKGTGKSMCTRLSKLPLSNLPFSFSPKHGGP